MRPFLLIMGIVALTSAWGSGLPQVAAGAFSAHMTMHMLVVAVAAPLLSLGMAGSSFDPVPKFPAIFAPIPLSVLELIAVWGWHTPALHHAARHSLGGLIAEQATFLVCGLLLWLSAFGGKRREDPNRAAAGIGGLLLTSMHMTLLGALLALAPRPLYHHVEASAGLTPLQDQHLGGAIMLLIGGVSYLAGGIALAAALLRRRIKPSPVGTP